MLGHVFVAGYAGVGYGIEEDGVSIASIVLTGQVDFMINLDPAGDGIFGALLHQDMTAQLSLSNVSLEISKSVHVQRPTACLSGQPCCHLIRLVKISG